jgi:hypothetical protein
MLFGWSFHPSELFVIAVADSSRTATKAIAAVFRSFPKEQLRPRNTMAPEMTFTWLILIALNKSESPSCIRQL